MNCKKTILISFSAFLLLVIPSFGNAHEKSNWDKHYQPIEDQAAHQHLKKMMEYAAQTIGPPSQPVNAVHLRLSKPLQPTATMRQNFQLTEIDDPDTGKYTIYLSRCVDHYAFWGQLAHEASHLLDPLIHDAYFEGLSTVLAEKYLKANGLDWNGWNEYFLKGAEPFYANTYFMMREIWMVVGDERLKNFHRYVKQSSLQSSQRSIDIHQWIQTLPQGSQQKVKKIIAFYAPRIQLAIREGGRAVNFLLPL